jgi:hypothetical protein
MKTKYELGIVEVIFIALIGAVLAWAGFAVWNEVDFHAKCDGTVLEDTWGNNYCLNPEVLEGARNP